MSDDASGWRQPVVTTVFLVHLCTLVTVAAALQVGDLSYLSWPADRAETVIRAMDKNGRVGGRFDTRILSTNRSYNSPWVSHRLWR